MVDLTDLTHLKNEAMAVDAEAEALTAPPAGELPPGADAPAQEPALSPIEEARGLIDLGVSLAVPFFPSLDKVYTADAKDRLARAAAPLLEKYGLSISSLFAKWKEEIDFAFVALPLVLQTVRAVQADRAAKVKADKEEAEKIAKGLHGGFKAAEAAGAVTA